jgi:hypothetical protein
MFWYIILLVLVDEFIITEIRHTLAVANPVLASEFIIGVYVISLIIASVFVYKFLFLAKQSDNDDEE